MSLRRILPLITGGLLLVTVYVSKPAVASVHCNYKICDTGCVTPCVDNDGDGKCDRFPAPPTHCLSVAGGCAWELCTDSPTS